MKRRVVVAAVCLVLGMSHAAGQPSYKISAAQLQQALSQRFPVRHKVEGLINFDVQEPRLRLLPEQNRIASEMLVDVAGPALRRSYTGALELDFELRYEPTDQSIMKGPIKREVTRVVTPAQPSKKRSPSSSLVISC